MERLDEAIGLYTGAGAIFGVTGGVMEAPPKVQKICLKIKILTKLNIKMFVVSKESKQLLKLIIKRIHRSRC